MSTYMLQAKLIRVSLKYPSRGGDVWEAPVDVSTPRHQENTSKCELTAALGSFSWNPVTVIPQCHKKSIAFCESEETMISTETDCSCCQ